MDASLITALLFEKGFDDAQGGQQALQAGLSGLAAQLLPVDRRWFQDLIPDRYRVALPDEGPHAGDRGGRDAATVFYARYAVHRGIPEGRAREEAQVVLRVVAHQLAPAARRRLIDRLPDPLGELLERLMETPPPVAPHPAPTLRTEAHTLSGGRPGPKRSLAEARPGSTHPLSEKPSKNGPDRTLAGGRPGSEHPLSETHHGPPKGRDDRRGD